MKDIDAGKEICSFLKKKLALFNQYLSITKRMKETLRNKEARNPGVFISERQSCIKRIERIDVSMDKIIKASSDKPYRISDKVDTPTQTLPLEGEGEGGGERLINSYLAKIKGIMETIDPIDRELMVMVKEEGGVIKKELLKMRNHRQAAQGYKKEKGYSPRLLDAIR